MPKAKYTIAVLGLWHLGEIYSAGLAELRHTVIGIDEDKKVIADFLRGVPPLEEPDLRRLIEKNRSAKRLSYADTISAVAGCNVVWLTLDTPVNDRDESDLAPMMAILRKAIPHFKNNVVVVVSSQIPVGTSQAIQNLIKKFRPRLKFHYVYTPENLRLGEAVHNFLMPGRIVVGANDDEGFEAMEEIFHPTKARLLRMSPESAEVTKHALNAFLATSISFVNDIADISERVGADILDVVQALRLDPRIGERAALNAGMGFSGGTLGRDLVALKQSARKNKQTLPIIDQVYKKNASRPAKVVARLAELLGGLKGKRIGLYGLTYKPGTTTLRRSRSLEIAALLKKRGAILALCDPHVSREDIIQDPYMAARNAHAMVFVTPWPDFQTLNFERLARAAQRHAIVFDTTNFLHEQATLIKRQGLRYYGIGR